MIRVCFVINNKFREYCATAILSILENSKSKFHFYIFHSGLKDKNIFKKLKTKIDFFEVNIDKNWYVPKGGHLDYVNYFKLLISDHLSGKVIYLDSDLIVLKDLKELWDMPLGKASIIGCKSRTSDSQARRLYKNFKREMNVCINAGVMIMDLDKLKKVRDKFFEYAKGKILDNLEQDVINCVLSVKKGEIKLIPQNWNTEVRIDIDVGDYLPIIKNPYIIHYITPDKPWKKDCLQPYVDKWRYYNGKLLSPTT
jgi:lipopolysaccharide biosynthesis glycosyltransferase